MSTKERRVQRVLKTAVFYLVLLWLGGMLLLGNIACVLLFVVPKSVRQPFLQGRISATFRLFLAGCELGGIMRLDLKTLDQLNAQHGTVLVANHPSMIDVFLILSRVRRGVCLMKASLTTNAFLATGAYLAGYISNQNAAQVVRDAVSAVEGGSALLIFPEGTRTERQPVNDLQPGFGLIAKRAGAPIQTILLETTSPYLTKGWPIWRAPPFPMVFTARVGTVMTPCAQTQETARQLQRYFEDELSSSINPASTQRS